MYVPPAFNVHRAVGLAFAAARGFGQVIACEGGPPGGFAAAIPCVGSGRPIAVRPISRRTFQSARPACGQRWTMADRCCRRRRLRIAALVRESRAGPHVALYEAVQLCGPVHVVPPAHTPDHLDRLAAQFESGLTPKPPWTADGLSSQRRATLLESIVAIEMTVETVEGSFKLNQHKADADHVAVVRALREQGKPSMHAIAARMVALRPHLAYE